MATRRPTISDVAARAGVSTATVSRVLNGGKWVSAEKAKAVQEAIIEVGFTANPTARSLRTGRSATIAFLVHGPTENLFQDPTYARLFTEISHALNSFDYSLVLLVAENRQEGQRALRVIRRRTLDAVILIPQAAHDWLLPELVATGLPVVNCGYPTGLEHQVSYACADDAAGGRQAAEHLLGRGRRRLGIIAGPPGTDEGETRVPAFVEAAGDAFVQGALAHGDWTRHSGRVAADELLARHPDLDGLFVASDVMAAGALEALATRGIPVPQQVSVVGFDDNPVALSTEPALTTVRQAFDRIASELVRLLDATMREGEVGSTVVPVELVERGSS